MPFANEHSCRLREPNLFQANSFRRIIRKASSGKLYSIIMGRLKGKTEMAEQAYRYNKQRWTESEAHDHCSDHKGRFEPAGKK